MSVPARVEDMPWWGWGRADARRPLPPALRALLEQTLGMAPRDTPAPPLAELAVPPGALRPEALAALRAVEGAGHVLSGAHARLLHSGGKSTVDLLARRGAAATPAVDAVVMPASHAGVLGVLRACTAHRIAVVPFGGGTGVVGGVTPLTGGLTGCVSLDLRRLDRLLEVDSLSLLATMEAGLRTPRAEDLLREQGLTLGHHPQSFAHATLGGFAATRSCGQMSAGWGRFDDLVAGVVMATPLGTLDLGRAPASAAGPDLRQLVLGSEGTLGVITQLRLRVRPLPEERRYEGWSVPDLAAGMAALRRLAQSDAALPTVVRLSDAAETTVGAAAAGVSAPLGCLVITGFEGDGAAVFHRRAAAAALLEAAGATALGPEPGEQWLRSRDDAPYLRDALLDVGALAETLETATTWSNLERLHAAVGAALAEALRGQGTPPLVLCHVSHVYRSGASLYFTVVAAQAADPVAQWAAAKRAAGDAIAACGATISHHHGVGTEHLPWMAAEIGELGIEMLRALKACVDPAGILNPGKLIPSRADLPSPPR